MADESAVEPDTADESAVEPVPAAEPDGAPDAAADPPGGVPPDSEPAGEPARHRSRPGRRRGRRGRNPRWATLCVVFGLVLAIVSAVTVVGTQAITWWATAKLHTEPLLPPEELPGGGGGAQNIGGPLNVLLLGMDERESSTDLIRTDTVIIVHINATHDQVSLISLPRDAMVDAPPYPDTDYPGGRQKLTEVFAMANRKKDAQGRWVGDDSVAGRRRGVQLLVRTIDSIVPGGLRFNAVAIINFVGFQKLVTALGGITMCIDERTISKHLSADGNPVGDTKGRNAKVYERGCRHLQAWEALDYVRQRYYLELGDGDYGRQRHQQQFLYAVFKQLLSKQTLTDTGKFGALRDAAGQLLTLDLGGIAVTDWLFSLRGIRTGDVALVRTNGGKYATKMINGQSFEILEPDTIRLLQAVHSDTVDVFVTQHPGWLSSPSGA